jgi:hypothetical protein
MTFETPNSLFYIELFISLEYPDFGILTEIPKKTVHPKERTAGKIKI